MPRRRNENDVGSDVMLNSRARRAKRRYQQMKAERGPTESILQNIAEYVVGRGDFTTENRTDKRRDYYIYDNTAQENSQRLAAMLYAVMLTERFFTLGLMDHDLEDDEEVAVWLDDTGRRMLDEITAPQSNFDTQAYSMIRDLIDFGTAGLKVEDIPGEGIRFGCVPLGQLFIAEDGYGRVDTVCRRFHLTNHQIWDRWGTGIEDPSVREDFRERAIKQPDERRYVIHMIEPNRFGDKDRLGRKRKLIATFVDVQTETEFEYGFFDEMPIVTPRWDPIPGIPYGSSPGRVAIGPQMTLSEMERTTMEQAQKAVSPPLLVPNDGTMVQVNTGPDAIIPYSFDVSSQRGSGIEYLESRSRFEVSDAGMERRKEAVRAAYFSDVQGLPESPYFTATQVVELSRQLVRRGGAMLKRVEVEAWDPLLRRIFSSMSKRKRNGFLPPPPQLENKSLTIKYISPAALAQKAEDADAMRRWRLSCVEAAGVKPEAMDVCNIEETLRLEAEALGITAGSGAVNSRKLVAAMRQARNEASQEQQDQQEILQASQVAKNIAPSLNLVQGGGAA